MKKSNITLNIFLLFLTMQIAMTFSKVYSQSQWELTTIPNETNNGYVVDVDFINANSGFIALKVNPIINKMIIYKTTVKGLNFSEFWSTTYYDQEFGISFNNAPVSAESPACENPDYRYIRCRDSADGMKWLSV